MRWAEVARRILRLAEVIHRWIGALSLLEPERRERVATYAEAIADTLSRAADVLAEIDPSGTPSSLDPKTRRTAIRELGRIHGYVSTMVNVLDHRLDGRRLGGVKKRLEKLDRGALRALIEEAPVAHQLRVDDLYAAEGYFRALSDGLRV
jgi:hypothetical protein